MGGVILAWAFLGLATVQRLGSVGSPRGWGVLALGPAAFQLLLVSPARVRNHPSLEWASLLFVPTAAALAACVAMVVLLLGRRRIMTASLWTWDTFHIGSLVIGILWTSAEVYITYRQGRDKRSWGKREYPTQAARAKPASPTP